jgi:hypothetical protein
MDRAPARMVGQVAIHAKANWPQGQARVRRYGNKRDLAEAAIVDALIRVGAWVKRLDLPADLLVYFRERWYLLEVKTPKGKKKTIAVDKRQEAQRRFLELTKTPIVKTPDEALKFIGAI